MASKEVITKFNLITGEATYAGQNAQDPATARRLQSLIPSLKGELVREKGQPKYLPTQLPAFPGALFQYDYNDTSGNQQSKRFVATATQLFMEVGGAWVAQTIINPATNLNTNTPFVGYPSFEVINNLLHFSDGVNNWLYDGPNGNFVTDGFPIPLHGPGVLSTATAGAITALIGRYYWYTFADETSGRVHESTSSPISVNFTGPIAAKQVTISAQNDTINTTLGSPTVVSVGAGFVANLVGLALYVAGTFYGVVTAFIDSSHLTISANAPATNAGAVYLLAPVRATHIHWYGSESDGSKLGKFLGKLAVTAVSPNFTDNSPFLNQAGSTIINIDRPIRNDPPPASSVLATHKYRLFRRRETIPNRFTYSANEEVLAGANGSPQESVPGTSPITLSDIVNETAYPKSALAIRAMKSHGDALYIATEKEIIPLWGDTIGQFALSQVTAVDGGAISRWGLESTSHGLVIFSYDRKLYLYPPVSPIYALTPEDINVTDQLVELGIAMRSKFLTIKASDVQNVRILKYKYNLRDWLIVCYQDSNSTYHTFAYDFETKGWVEFQRGFVSVAVFETSPGVKILVGGAPDGFVYVADDLTGAIAPNTTFPPGTFRTALIDFGHPDVLHKPKYLELEVTNPAIMDSSTTVNFYLDPQDADNLPTAIQLNMSPVPGENTRYRGFFSASEGGMGVICRRLMIEFSVAADTNDGAFRGIVLKADPVSGMMR